jgi:pimeloyl-ACP methyl ester carboxylesterase
VEEFIDNKLETASLLLLHGNGGGGFRFSRCQEHFRTGLRVFTPTLPGFYPAAPHSDLRDLSDFARVLVPIIEGMPRPRSILGTGIGGSLLLELLQHHPNIADQLILHAPVGAHLDRRLFPKLLRVRGVAALAKNLIGHPLLRPFWRRLFFEKPLPKEFVQEFFRGYLHCQVFGLMFRLITQEWWVQLRPIAVPTVILWGARERLLTVDQKDPFLELLPNSRAVVVEDWRHFPMVEQPIGFVEKVEQCL